MTHRFNLTHGYVPIDKTKKRQTTSFTELIRVNAITQDYNSKLSLARVSEISKNGNIYSNYASIIHTSGLMNDLRLVLNSPLPIAFQDILGRILKSSLTETDVIVDGGGALPVSNQINGGTVSG